MVSALLDAAHVEAAMAPHVFVDSNPPAVHLVALGDLGGAIGASLLVSARGLGLAAAA
jgi:hypothetical protein